jgi:multidrug efflux pump subunit AcrA (membrane-fusion protein)
MSKRFVDIGDHVAAGQTLALIESPDVDQQLFQAQAQESQSHAMTLQAVADLANKQATVSQYSSNVSQAEANVEQTNAQLIDAQAKLAQLVAAKAMAETQLDEAKHQVSIKQAALVQADTQRDLADVTYKRYKTLLDSGYVSLQDADQADATYKTEVAAVNSAQADLKASQSAVMAAEQFVQSAEANVHSGEAEVVAAQKSVRAITATVHANKATVTAAQANVRLGQSNVSANLDAERANKYNTKHYAVLTGFEKVVAPFAGVITARNVDVGTLVSAGAGSGGSAGPSSMSSQGASVNVGSASSASTSPSTASGGGLFGVARTDIIRILVSVPEIYSKTVRTGDSARIEIREFPGRTFKGTVTRMAGALDTNSRTLLTEVHIDNRDGAILPGMFAQVHFSLKNQSGDVRVPSSAIIFDALGTRVAAVDQDNKIHLVNIKVIRDYGKQIDINELPAGVETIVADPTDDLTDGEVVKPVLITSPTSGGASASSGSPSQPAASSKGASSGR